MLFQDNPFLIHVSGVDLAGNLPSASLIWNNQNRFSLEDSVSSSSDLLSPLLATLNRDHELLYRHEVILCAKLKSDYHFLLKDSDFREIFVHGK